MQLTWGVGLEDVLKTLSIHLCLSGHMPPAAALLLRPGSWPLHREQLDQGAGHGSLFMKQIPRALLLCFAVQALVAKY